VFCGCAWLGERARSYGAEIPGLFIAFDSMIRHSGAANAASPRSRANASEDRGCRAQLAAQYHEFSEEDLSRQRAANRHGQ
jgi:hypothetical protein